MVFTLPLLLHRGSTPSPPLTPSKLFPPPRHHSLFLSMRHLLPHIQTTAVATSDQAQSFPRKTQLFWSGGIFGTAFDQHSCFPGNCKKNKGGIRAKKRPKKKNTTTTRREFDSVPKTQQTNSLSWPGKKADRFFQMNI